MSDEERLEKFYSKGPNTLKQIEQAKQTEANSYFSNLFQGEEIDESCIHVINRRLVRIQYPGVVKNLDKALDTLGCISGIEKAVSNNRLELNFHPKNKYNKGVVADTNSNSGILVKVTKQQKGSEPPVWSYEIIGATVKTFVFNKFVDFQYLPLVAEYPENQHSNVDFIYDSILPDRLLTLESALKEDKISMPLFLPPVGYSRSDIQKKINPVTKQPTNETTDSRVSLKKRGRKLMAFSRQKQPSIFHKFSEPDIPEKPTDFISKLVGRRNYHDHLMRLEELFRERPIWTKNGLKYNSHFSNDLLKVLLPAVAYYELTGPWRCTWIRFGYDPRKDPESNKYQNLDYRIPFSVRANLKIGSNRVPEAKVLPTSLEKLNFGNDKRKKYVVYQENSYLLRPNVLPTARQVFYQYCDILLPEIQTMLSRLPPVTPDTKCDPKNGWFPSSFVDQCREVVNIYIDQQAAKVLRKQRESLPSNPIEELFEKTNKLIEQKRLDCPKPETIAGPSTSSEDFDSLTIYDSDESVSECEKFYQENDLYDLADQLDDSMSNSDSQIIAANTLEELNKIMKVRKKPTV